MSGAQPTPLGRTVVIITVSGLIVALAASSYVLFNKSSELAAARNASSGAGAASPDAGPRHDEAWRLMYRVSVLLAAVLLVLVFAIGSYLLIRIGRAITYKRIGGQPTKYVDAWGNYRLTDEQIAAATDESDSASDGERDDADQDQGG